MTAILLPTALNPFSSPITGMPVDVVTLNVRGNDNALSATVNGILTALGGGGGAPTLQTLTFGTHLTGTSYNGSAPVTIATDAVSANTVSAIMARDSNGDTTVTGVLAGGVYRSAVSQVSGAGAGFDLFAPTVPLSYHLLVAGKDAANGNTPSNAFLDEVTINAAGVWTVPTPWHSQTLVGSPGARTYTNSSGKLHIAVASGPMWYIDIAVTRFAS